VLGGDAREIGVVSRGALTSQQRLTLDLDVLVIGDVDA
jgi:hypothetical protein